jgi:hypothetical protein
MEVIRGRERASPPVPSTAAAVMRTTQASTGQVHAHLRVVAI